MALNTLEGSYFILDKLPLEAVINILSYVGYQDLIRCCITCKRLREAAEDNQLWRHQCRRVWAVTQSSSGKRWKDTFESFYIDYGRYVDIYAQVRKAWDQIEDFTEEYSPHIHETLQDGLSESDLDTIERQVRAPLPNDLRCVYRMHNGQKTSMVAGLGLLGTMSVYNVYVTLLMCDLKDAAHVHLASDRAGPKSLLEVGRCYHSDVSYHVVLSDVDGRTPGHVLCPARVESSAYEEFFMDPLSANSLQSRVATFMIGDSYLDWFSQYADHLIQNRYPVQEDAILNFLEEPTCVEWTGNIKVKVSTRFCPEHSTVDPSEFFHVYRIQISMHEDASESEACKLTTRHWVISDAQGKEQYVNGPGVIGEYPVMRPGAQFAYCSCTTFQTSHGSMGGHFKFVVFKTGEEIQVKCPTFHMKSLPYETHTDRQARLLQRKKDL